MSSIEYPKIYFIVLDGAADHPIESLGGKTPLEAAHTPNLDLLCRRGVTSLIEILPDGLTPETDSGLMALLGYEPKKYYFGRGSLEALGCELFSSYKYYVGFRVNYASYNNETGFLNRRTERDLSDDELKELCNEIKKGVDLSGYSDISFDLISFGTHRGILIFYSNNSRLSGNVSNTDPGFNKVGFFSIPIKNNKHMRPQTCVPLDDDISSSLTASIVNDFIKQSSHIMENSKVNVIRKQRCKLPCNMLLVRDGGGLPIAFPSFEDRYNRNIVIFGQLPCEKALASLIGGDFQYTQEFELQLDKHYLDYLGTELLNTQSDVVFCHLKGPDEPGHDDKPFEKVKAIELIDNSIFDVLVNGANNNHMVVVTCDHATPCEMGIHSNDKVPLLISYNGIDTDGSLHFDERTAENGSCSMKKAIEVMQYITSIGVYNG